MPMCPLFLETRAWSGVLTTYSSTQETQPWRPRVWHCPHSSARRVPARVPSSALTQAHCNLQGSESAKTTRKPEEGCAVWELSAPRAAHRSVPWGQSTEATAPWLCSLRESLHHGPDKNRQEGTRWKLNGGELLVSWHNIYFFTCFSSFFNNRKFSHGLIRRGWEEAICPKALQGHPRLGLAASHRPS